MATKHFGEYIRKIRKDRGLTQQAAAEAAGISISSVSHQERQDVCHLNSDALRRLVDHYDKHLHLSDTELRFLRFNGSLPQGYSPIRKPNQGSKDQLDRLLLQNRGKLRDVVDALHNVLKQEAGNKAYLAELLRVATRLDVQFDLDPSDPVPEANSN